METMTVRVPDAAAAKELATFLCSAGLLVEWLDTWTFEVRVLHALHLQHAQLELRTLLAVWRVMRPDVEVELAEPGDTG